MNKLKEDYLNEILFCTRIIEILNERKVELRIDLKLYRTNKKTYYKREYDRCLIELKKINKELVKNKRELKNLWTLYEDIKSQGVLFK